MSTTRQKSAQLRQMFADAGVDVRVKVFHGADGAIWNVTGLGPAWQDRQRDAARVIDAADSWKVRHQSESVLIVVPSS